MGMFDFNGDGRTDMGEHFIGCQIFKDVTGPSSGGGKPRGRTDGFTVFIVIVFVFWLLCQVCDMMY